MSEEMIPPHAAAPFEGTPGVCGTCGRPVARTDAPGEEWVHADDDVWIRTTAETNVGGDDAVVGYVSCPRATWEVMTPRQREEYVTDCAVQALAEVASSGASVVDVDEVPARERTR